MRAGRDRGISGGGRVRLLVGMLLAGRGVLAANLSQVALQDLNGRGATDVENQSSAYLEIKSSAENSSYNRKALFLFDLSSFGGRDVRNQYIHSATFTLWAYDTQCSGYHFRLYGFTDTTANDDSRWDESLSSQSHANWPDRYSGADQYPAGTGVVHLDTKAGPGKNYSVLFGSNLISYVRWGAERLPGFGYSATNPDSKITLLLAREQWDADLSAYYSRQATNESYRPRLALDVRFPEIRVGIGTQTNLNSGGHYDFGAMAETNAAPRSRDLAIDNVLGEALSSLHVSSVVITGSQAHAFAVANTNFYLTPAQGTNWWPIVFNPAGNLEWGVWDQAWLVIANNDEDESIFRVRLRGEILPVLRLLPVEPDEDPQTFVLQWASRSGTWYVVSSHDSLTGGPWFSNAAVRAAGRTHSWTNPQPEIPRRFFRVEELP